MKSSMRGFYTKNLTDPMEKLRYDSCHITIQLRQILLGAIVYLIVFQNLVSKVFGHHLGAILIYVLYTMLFFITLMKLFSKSKIFIKYKMLAFLFVAINFSLLDEVVFDSGPFSMKILGYINDVFYIFIFIFVYNLLRKEDLEILVKSIVNAGVIAALIGIIQFLFHNQLPAFFLNPYKEQAFIIYSETFSIRPNGLVANSIIYSHFLLFISTLLLCKLLFSPNTRDFAKLIIVLLGTITVFSRSSLIGFVLIVIFVGMLGMESRYFKHMVFLKIVLTCLILATIFIMIPSVKAILLNKFYSLDPATKMSTIQHVMQIKNAIDTIKENPLFGVGIGSQGPSSAIGGTHEIITDGFWFELLLELGIIPFLLYLLFLFYVYVISFRIFLKSNSQTLKSLSLSFIAISTFFYIASFINSAFIGKVNFISYWLLFGIILTYRRNRGGVQ